MKSVLAGFSLLYGLMAALFAIAAVVLAVIATRAAWGAAFAGLDLDAAQAIINAVGVLTAGVVALQIAQTIVEEEVVRNAQVSAPTRVRRFLSRFLVVLVVALVIEGLVATLKALREDPTHMLHAAALVTSAAILLACWGVFVRLNRAAEDLEPQAIREATEEDRKLQ
ncbi:MAG TPA: hypothetical protein VGD76_18695 [Ramlibacter sp.]